MSPVALGKADIRREFGRMGKGNIILNDSGNKLVIGILKHHADGLSYLEIFVLVGGVKSFVTVRLIHKHLALIGNHNARKKLCKG